VIAGRQNGKTMRRQTVARGAPQTSAASSRSGANPLEGPSSALSAEAHSREVYASSRIHGVPYKAQGRPLKAQRKGTPTATPERPGAVSNRKGRAPRPETRVRKIRYAHDAPRRAQAAADDKPSHRLFTIALIETAVDHKPA